MLFLLPRGLPGQAFAVETSGEKAWEDGRPGSISYHSMPVDYPPGPLLPTAARSGDKAASAEEASGEEKDKTDEADGPAAPEKILVEYNADDIIIVELLHERSDSRGITEAIYEDPGLYLHWDELLSFMGYGFTETAQGAYDIASFNGNGALSVDFEGGSYVYEGEEVALNEEAVALVEGDYYVSEDLLNELFGLQINFDINMQQAELESELLFPTELQQRREERRQALEQRRQQRDPFASYEALDNRYSLFDVPFTDFYAQTRVRDYSNTTNTEGPTYEWSYNVQGAGDVGYLNAEWNLSGRDSDELERLRFKAGRKSVEPGLLGARSFYVGDLYAPRIDGIIQGQQGRGLEISNYPVIRSRDFSSTIIRGSVQPGWEVELYRGSLLIDYQTADAQNGEYEFSEVPLLYGQNEFRVQAYGPQGQVEERRIRRYVGPGMIEPGRLYYAGSFTQQNTPLLELSDRRRSTYGDEQPRLFTELEAGISRNLSATAWAYHLPLPDGQHTYVSAGLRSAFRLAALEASFIQDLDSGYALKFGAQSRLGSWNLNADHIRMFDGFEMEADLGFRRQYSSSTRARLGGYLPLRLYSTISLRDYRFNDGQYITLLQHSLRRRLGPVSLTNRVNFSLRERVDNFQYARGRFSARYRINRSIVPRAQLHYDVKDGFEAQELNGGLNWYPGEKTSFTATGGYQFRGLDRGYASLGVNRRFGVFTMGSNAYYSSDGNFSANISIRTGFARNPVSGRIRAHDRRVSSSSGLATLVYNTVPNTNPGREIIESAELLEGNSRRGFSAENGRSIFRSDLRSWSPLAFKLNEASLRDPAMMPPPNGFKYFSRPGKVLVQEIRIQITGEAEGEIYERDPSLPGDNLRPLADVPLRLIELDNEDAPEEDAPAAEESRQQTTSAFDGFYLFDRITEGRYRIDVDPQWLAEQELRMLTEAYEFEVIGDGTIFRNVDIVLGRAEEEREEDEGEGDVDLERDAFLLTEAERQELEQELLDQGMMLPCGEEIDFGAIYFGFDEDTLNEEALQTIQQHADLMFEYPTLTMLIEGFADQTGNEIYNERLSRRRAWAVQRALVELGVEPDRMFVRGRGEIREPCENEDDTGCAEHRKVISMRYTVFEMIFFERDDPTLTEAQREKLAMNLDILRVCQDVNVRVEALSDYLTGPQEAFEVVQQRRDEVLEFYIDQGLPEDRLDIELGVGTRFELPGGDTEEENRAQVLTVDANTASFFKADRQRKTYTVQLASSGVLENARERMQALSEATGRPTTVYYKPDTDTYIVTLAIEGSSFQAERELYRLRRDIEFRSAFLVPMEGLQDAQLGTEGLYEVRFGAFSSDEAAGRVRDYINSFSSEEAVVVYNERDNVYRVIARNALERDEAAFIIDEARRNGHDDLLILRLSELE